MRTTLLILIGLLLTPQLRAAAPTTAPAGLPVSEERIPHSARPLVLVKVPAGAIEMNGRRIEIKPLWISTTETTWDHFDPWRLCLDIEKEPDKAAAVGVSRPSQPYHVADRGYGVEGFATIGITARSAQLYCKWLSDKTGRTYRLATEAEWEYACRCGGPELRPDPKQLDKIAWFAGNSLGDDQEPRPHAVATRQPNAWGLYDMLGNVGEWVIGLDGRPVLKGGSFMDEAKTIDSSARWPFSPEWQIGDPESPKSKWWYRNGPQVGFRVVRED